MAADAVITFDYCDTCGPSIRAWVYVETATGGVLTWCAHCGKINTEELIAQGGRVTSDFSYMLGG